MYLYEALAGKVNEWRTRQFAHETFPSIAEILESAHNPDVSSFGLCAPQVRALDKTLAARARADLNPDQLIHQMVITSGKSFDFDQVRPAHKFIEQNNRTRSRP